ncbi:unnamed protein product [Calypogeia fissa]
MSISMVWPGVPPGHRDINKVESEIRIHSVDEDMDMTAHQVKVDILNIPDEAGSTVTAPLLNGVESGNRLLRNLSVDSHDEEQLFVQEQPAALRIHIPAEAAAFLPPKGLHSSRGEVGQARTSAETFLCSRLAFNLLRYLGVGFRWITKVLALGLYAALLMPGFLRVGYQYFFSKNIHRGIVYGKQPRNRLDLYLPEDVSSPKEVVIFITGGAWMIGYRAWGALLGIQLSERDVMVCCVDYRNFPHGKISDMVEDVSTSIGFVVNNIDQFGGDPGRVYLAGQSAGSHIAACALVNQAQIEIERKGETMTWRSSQIKAFLGVSGGYNLPSLVDHFHKRGLFRTVYWSIMEGETSLALYSPELAVQCEAFGPAVPLLPPIYLFHGTADYSIPSAASESFGSVLQQVGVRAVTKLYPEKTHTDVILQDPMRGGRDALFDDFMAVLHGDDEEAQSRDASAPPRPRLVPECLLHLAHVVSPF